MDEKDYFLLQIEREHLAFVRSKCEMVMIWQTKGIWYLEDRNFYYHFSEISSEEKSENLLKPEYFEFSSDSTTTRWMPDFSELCNYFS